MPVLTGRKADLSGRIVSYDHKCPATIELRRIERGGKVLLAIRITRQRLLARPGAARTACPGKQEHFFTSPIGQTGHWIRNDSPLQATYRGPDCAGHQRRNYTLHTCPFLEVSIPLSRRKESPIKPRPSGRLTFGPPFGPPLAAGGPMIVLRRQKAHAITPAGVIPPALVPWPAPVPAFGASNFVIAPLGVRRK